MGNIGFRVGLAVITLAAFFAPNVHAQQYTLTQIPVPSLSSFPPSANISGAYVQGTGLNNSGQVVGNLGGVIGNAPQQPFIYDQGSSQLLPYLTKPEDYAIASAINLNGIIVGNSENAFVQPNAVGWKSGSITFLGSLYYIQGIGSPAPAGYSIAAGINSLGDSVGTATVELGSGNTATFPNHATLYSGGTIKDLGTLGGANSEAFEISDSGIIVGDSETSQSTLSNAFYYDGTMHALGVLPGGTSSSAKAINAAGTIVGFSTTTGGGTGTHAVEWVPNGAGGYAIEDLGTLGPAGNYSQANAINRAGQIVGITDTPQNTQTAFICSGGVMTDLNSLLPAGSSVTLYEATAINDSGQILAYSISFATNARTTYLLTPNFPAPVMVPNVVGVTQTVASDTIAAANLDVGVVTIQNSGTVPAGVVISQTPAAGASLRVGAPVNLVVSSGLVSVPNVVGLANATATSLLTGAGLTDIVLYQYSAAIPISTPITVSTETPRAGTLVAQGSAVNLVFLTPNFVRVPNVVGLNGFASGDDAYVILCAAGFTNTVSYQPSPTVPPGIVVSQRPVAGTIFGVPSANAGCAPFVDPPIVNLVLSSGPVQVTVPNVVGITQAAATTLITTPGLVVGSVSSQPSSTVPSGSVISQSPAASTEVAIGGPVNLVVSSGPATISIVLGGAPVFTGTATGYSVSVPLKNTGNVTAQTVQELSATLNGSPAGGSVSSITLAPGATGNLVVKFPSAVVGLSAVLSVSGSYSGTSLSGSWSVGARAGLHGGRAPENGRGKQTLLLQ